MDTIYGLKKLTFVGFCGIITACYYDKKKSEEKECFYEKAYLLAYFNIDDCFADVCQRCCDARRNFGNVAF